MNAPPTFTPFATYALSGRMRRTKMDPVLA